MNAPQSTADLMEAALRATLWVLEHPEVIAIRFCGSPESLALQVRALLARVESERAASRHPT